MKILHCKTTHLFFAIIALNIFSAGILSSSTDEYWIKYNEAMNDGLPRTAIQQLEKIMAIAAKERNYGAWMTAFTDRVLLESAIQGNRPEEKIARLQTELPNFDEDKRCLLQAILAHWYWHYFVRNKHRFMSRTATTGPIGDDFTTWDLRKIFSTIDSLYQDLLLEHERMGRMPIDRYLDFLEPGNTPHEYRPTLLDFIAHEALNFYVSAEQVGARPEDAFEIDAQSAAFGPSDAFLRFVPATDDTSSAAYKALKIYQLLLDFHRTRGNHDAFVDLDIRRLEYMKNASFGDNKNQIFIERLSELSRLHGEGARFSFIAFSLAKAWQVEQDLVKAYEIAREGYTKSPDSYGGKSCKALMEDLMAKTVTIECEQCVPCRPSTMNITYKNFSTLYFRICPDDWQRFMKKENGWPYNIDSLELKELLARTPLREWAVELPATPDLQSNTIEVELPELTPGYYRIFASWAEDFSDTTMVAHTWFWVSSMTIVNRSSSDRVDGFVLDAISGEPVQDVKVTQIVYTEHHFTRTDSVWSDADGYFSFSWPKIPVGYVVFTHAATESEELFDATALRRYGHWYAAKPCTTTFFFTDRSLYRPGQTVHFKGICVFTDPEGKDYRTIPNMDVSVKYMDVNSRKIAESSFRSNDFGSFSGSFSIPTDLLTGGHSIRSDYPRGEVAFHVEEYKRPKFTVEIDVPEKAYRLADTVDVVGKAISYTGAPVNNALVTYRIQRGASYPYWRSWRYPGRRYWNRSSFQLITHGTTHTDEQGRFAVRFHGRPDPGFSAEDDPRFSFTIQADVTSPDGETRSASRHVVLGYTALEIRLACAAEVLEQERFSIEVTTQTLDGVEVPAAGRLIIYRLKEPPQPVPQRFWSHQSTRVADKPETAAFAADWRSWPRDTLVFAEEFSTEHVDPESVDAVLPAGFYIIECNAHDRYGKEVVTLLPLLVLPDWDRDDFSLMLPFFTTSKSTTVEVGNNLEMLWGTGYETGRCFVEVEHDNKILKRYWTDKRHTQHVLRMPVTEKFRGGFVVYLTQVRENRAYLETVNVSVPWDNKDLIITTETFRDKLQPGGKEKIRLKIEGKKKYIAAAEMVGAMYDYSLDQFRGHNWPVFRFFKTYRSQRSAFFVNNRHPFTITHFPIQRTAQYPAQRTFVHFPDHLVRDFFRYQFPRRSIVTYGKHREFPGNYGKIRGKVLDAATGKPLVGADVVIDGTDLGAATDANGEFVIQYVPQGRWSITASYISYDPEKYFDVRSISGHVTVIEFRLGPTGIEVRGVTAIAEREAIVSDQSGPHGTYARPIERLERLGMTTVTDGIDVMAGFDPFSEAELRNIRVREDFSETAFFLPHLRMDDNGSIVFEFIAPEVLTKWKFIGFAHGKKCESGAITEYAVTRKDLMVLANPPRFLRERDTILFTAKVVNMSDRTQTGRVQLDFKDLITDEQVNGALGLTTNVYGFDIVAHGSETFAWKLQVPEGANAYQYTVVAKSGFASDGESDALAVLPNRIFLTETQPLHVRGGQSKHFDFDRLREVERSKTLDPYCFTVQVVSNPAWYAIQALPYLSRSPFECSEQAFNRYYANSMAGFIANSDPHIAEVFEKWRGTEALLSNLEKNEQLKSVLLQETPWVRQAERESGAKHNIAMLFDEDTLQRNIKNAYAKLVAMQNADGSWGWFPGGRTNAYITLYITTGFARLRHLGVPVTLTPALSALNYLDVWITSVYDSLKDKSANNLNHHVAFFLYGRSFFLEDREFSPRTQEAIDYFVGQAENYWLTLDSRLSQGYLALALHRLGKSTTARKIAASLKERSVYSEELGMFWREEERSWWWYRAPIETQALMIEVFDEIAGDSASVEECKIWLLKQKQTHQWHTTKATADVVYALLLRGVDWLASTELVDLKLAGKTIVPEHVEAGTSFYEKSFLKEEIVPDFADITITKKDPGISWGGAFFQYYEEMENVTPFSGNLQLEKKIYVNRDTKQGRLIEPVTDALKVGDLITVRIILRVDRDMEFVHLKDMRGSGLEPVDVISQYRYQDGLRYYQSTKDAASHFFVDYLPKGTYVFEYQLRVQHRGIYQSGIAEIQCMYAPEFSSHSQSQWLTVD